MDDFLRNFFVKMGLARTCETFEAEWYELKATGKLEGSQLVPDIYQRNAVRNYRGCWSCLMNGAACGDAFASVCPGCDHRLDCFLDRISRRKSLRFGGS